MNSTLTTSFFTVLALGLRPGLASAQGPEHAIPSVGVLAGGGLAAQAAAVQRAVGKYQGRARTPEHLAQYLAQVLTPSEFNQFLQLQDNADARNSLRSLALR